MLLNSPLYEGQVVTMSLKFAHLYGDKWAVFYGQARRHNLRRIIFPQFVPEEGVQYEVRVAVTKTGVFSYNGEDFRVCRAELVASATSGEVLVHQIFGRQEVFVSPEPLLINDTFAQKLALAGFGKK